MYQLNPLLEGNGALSTAMNVTKQKVAHSAVPKMAKMASDKSLPFLKRAKAWTGSKLGKVMTTKPMHKLNRNLTAGKLKSVRTKEGSAAGRAYRDYLVQKEKALSSVA